MYWILAMVMPTMMPTVMMTRPPTPAAMPDEPRVSFISVIAALKQKGLGTAPSNRWADLRVLPWTCAYVYHTHVYARAYTHIYTCAFA